MSQGPYILGATFALCVLFAIFLKLRNSGMKERYAIWWTVVAVLVAVVSLFPNLLAYISGLLGVQVPLNLAFFLSGIALLLLSLQFSVELSEAQEERRRLCEEISILSLRIEMLEKRCPSAEKE